MGNKCKEDRAGLQCQSKLVVGEAQCGETIFEVEFLGIFTRYYFLIYFYNHSKKVKNFYSCFRRSRKN